MARQGDREQRQHARSRRLHLFPARLGEDGPAQDRAQDTERSRVSARRAVLRCGRERQDQPARGLVLFIAATQDETCRSLDRLLGRRRDQVAYLAGEIAVTSSGVVRPITTSPTLI